MEKNQTQEKPRLKAKPKIVREIQSEKQKPKPKDHLIPKSKQTKWKHAGPSSQKNQKTHQDPMIKGLKQSLCLKKKID